MSYQCNKSTNSIHSNLIKVYVYKHNYIYIGMCCNFYNIDTVLSHCFAVTRYIYYLFELTEAKKKNEANDFQLYFSLMVLKKL